MKTITLEPVEWEFEKSFVSTDWPLWFDSPDETYVKNSYIQGSASITFAVNPDKYVVNYPWYDGSSLLSMSINLTANIAEGFVENASIIFREDYDASQVELFGWRASLWNFENFTTRDLADSFYQDWKLGGDLKAFIEASSTNREVEISGWVSWILKAPENVSQQLKITTEVTYFNGTNHVKVTLPTVLTLVADAGSTPETARTINPGNCTANIDYIWDPKDFYRIWLTEGQKIRIQTILRGPSVNLTLSDQDGKVKASAALETNYDYEPRPLSDIAYTIDAEGYWYIEVSEISHMGTYRLIIEVEPS